MKVKLTSIEHTRACDTPGCRGRCSARGHYCAKCHVARDRERARARMRTVRSTKRSKSDAPPPVEISTRPYAPTNVPLALQCQSGCGARLSSVNVFGLCDGCRDSMTRVQVRDWALGRAVPEVRAVMAQFEKIYLTDEETTELKALTFELQRRINKVAEKIKNENKN